MSSIYRRGTIYWWSAWANGRKLRKSLHTRSRRVALARKAELDLEYASAGISSEDEHTFRSASTLFLDTTRSQRGVAWHQAHVSRLQKVGQQLGPVKLEDVTTLQLDQALNALQADRRFGPKGRNDYIASLRSMFRWALARRLLRHDPTQAMTRMRLPKKRPVILTDAQWEAFVTRHRRSIHFPMFATVLYAGVRKMEMAQLEWTDWDFARLRVTLRAAITKDREDRVIPFPPVLAKLLRPLRRETGLCFPGPDGQVWNVHQLDGLIKPFLRAVGVTAKRTGWHTLRHSYATRYLDRGGSLRRLQKRLGHRSIETTERYAHDDAGENDTARLV